MKQKLSIIIKYAVLLLGIVFLSACAFRGDVYVAFYWATANDQPNPALSDFSNVPNAPADLNDLINGGYFLTIPGSYSIVYRSNLGSNYNSSITLEAAMAVGGFETTYYNIYLSDTNGITVDTVP